jgi:hypothetical protein
MDPSVVRQNPTRSCSHLQMCETRTHHSVSALIKHLSSHARPTRPNGRKRNAKPLELEYFAKWSHFYQGWARQNRKVMQAKRSTMDGLLTMLFLNEARSQKGLMLQARSYNSTPILLTQSTDP